VPAFFVGQIGDSENHREKHYVPCENRTRKHKTGVVAAERACMFLGQ
jgi:hypothetical protein